MSLLRPMSIRSLSTSHLSSHNLCSATKSLLYLHKPIQPNHAPFLPSLSLSSFPSLSRTGCIEPQRPNLSIFFVFSSIQAQATTDSQELEQSITVEESESSGTRLLAQNIPWTSTADDLRRLFVKYGSVVDIELSMYNKTRNRGLVFVTMGSHEEAVAALNNLEAYEFEGRTLKLSWAKPPKKKSSPPQPKPVPIHNLFVANLAFQARAKDLREFFNAENANVVSAEIIFHDNPRRSAGYGFVSFNTKEEADAALSAFQGKVFMGRSIRVARSKRFLRQETKVAIQSENCIK